ncbi:MAG TPA: STAS domain-containing protein [Acidimicrobiales bacterium]|nr:STAS domain-containing protein [Acidimicrobiales bacterium]
MSEYVTVRLFGEAVIVIVRGPVDANGVVAAVGQLAPLAPDGTLILDLTEATLVSPAPVRELLGGLLSSRPSDRLLVVCRRRTSLQILRRWCRAHPLQICPTIEDALRRMRAVDVPAGPSDLAWLHDGFRIEVDVDADGGGVVLRLAGELDIATAPQLSAALAELRRVGVDHVVVDLSGLAFLDVRGVGVLVDHHWQTVDRGGSLRLEGAQGPVRRVLITVPLAAGIDLVGEVGIRDKLAASLREER